MIDAHCHLEQSEFDADLDKVIEDCKAAGIKALVTCCAHPKDFEKSLGILERFQGYVFLCAGLHPEFISEIKESEKDEYLERIKNENEKISAIGEIGLDYFWCPEKDKQAAQQELFAEMLEFAHELRKPVVIHIRGARGFPDEAFSDAFKILEDAGNHALLHLFGARRFAQRALENDFYISIGPSIATSKDVKKIARDFPLEKIALETDSPWFGGKDKEGRVLRGTPLNIKIAATEIAQIKKLSFKDVWAACGRTAAEFFKLKI
jgi:TatD DNase family protein